MTSHGGEISVTEANPKIAEFVINHEIWEHWLHSTTLPSASSSERYKICERYEIAKTEIRQINSKSANILVSIQEENLVTLCLSALT